MQTGWHHDTADGNWYYLIPEGGMMAVGWRKIGDKWYYFETAGAGVYTYNRLGKLEFRRRKGRPLGSMIKRKTPDGFATDADGAWIQ